jgi:hypothetical protein
LAGKAMIRADAGLFVETQIGRNTIKDMTGIEIISMVSPDITLILINLQDKDGNLCQTTQIQIKIMLKKL